MNEQNNDPNHDPNAVHDPNNPPGPNAPPAGPPPAESPSSAAVTKDLVKEDDRPGAITASEVHGLQHSKDVTVQTRLVPVDAEEHEKWTKEHPGAVRDPGTYEVRREYHVAPSPFAPNADRELYQVNQDAYRDKVLNRLTPEQRKQMEEDRKLQADLGEGAGTLTDRPHDEDSLEEWNDSQREHVKAARKQEEEATAVNE